MEETIERHDVSGLARNSIEAHFYISLHPCASCGSRSDKGLEYTSTQANDGVSLMVGWYSGACAQCGAKRWFHFRHNSWHGTDGADPYEFGPYELGRGPAPSMVILPDEFLAEIDRLSSEVLESPESLILPRYDTSWDALQRSLTCWTELKKFLPTDSDEISDNHFRTDASRSYRDAHRDRFTRDGIVRESSRYDRLLLDYLADLPRYHAMREEEAAKAPPPPPRGVGLDKVALESHRLWVKHGDAKGHRIDIADVDASRMKLSAIELSGTVFTRVSLAEADLSVSEAAKSNWTDVKAPRVRLGSTSLAGSRLVRCDFTEAGMGLTKIGDSVIEDCAFDRADLDRSTWYRCDVARSTFRGAVFGQASLDDAVFVDCDFRGASFAMNPKGVLGGASFTWFIRCDLRDTDWTGRWVHHTVFEDCLVAGIHGTPHEVAYAHVIRPSFSATGDATPGKGLDDLVATWGYTGKLLRAVPGDFVDRKRPLVFERIENGAKVTVYTEQLSPLLQLERARKRATP